MEELEQIKNNEMKGILGRYISKFNDFSEEYEKLYLDHINGKLVNKKYEKALEGLSEKWKGLIDETTNKLDALSFDNIEDSLIRCKISSYLHSFSIGIEINEELNPAPTPEVTKKYDDAVKEHESKTGHPITRDEIYRLAVTHMVSELKENYIKQLGGIVTEVKAMPSEQQERELFEHCMITAGVDVSYEKAGEYTTAIYTRSTEKVLDC